MLCCVDQAGSNSVLERLTREKKPAQFQSKYEGRHNGGVPCFTEERSLERAAKVCLSVCVCVCVCGWGSDVGGGGGSAQRRGALLH